MEGCQCGRPDDCGNRPATSGDFARGVCSGYVATLMERHSRFLMLIKVPNRDTGVVVAALSRHVRKLPATLRRSLTWDRGLEMAKHKEPTSAIRKVPGSVARTTIRICGPHHYFGCEPIVARSHLRTSKSRPGCWRTTGCGMVRALAGRSDIEGR